MDPLWSFLASFPRLHWWRFHVHDRPRCLGKILATSLSRPPGYVNPKWNFPTIYGWLDFMFPFDLNKKGCHSSSNFRRPLPGHTVGGHPPPPTWRENIGSSPEATQVSPVQPKGPTFFGSCKEIRLTKLVMSRWIYVLLVLCFDDCCCVVPPNAVVRIGSIFEKNMPSWEMGDHSRIHDLAQRGGPQMIWCAIWWITINKYILRHSQLLLLELEYMAEYCNLFNNFKYQNGIQQNQPFWYLKLLKKMEYLSWVMFQQKVSNGLDLSEGAPLAHGAQDRLVVEAPKERLERLEMLGNPPATTKPMGFLWKWEEFLNETNHPGWSKQTKLFGKPLFKTQLHWFAVFFTFNHLTSVAPCNFPTTKRQN